MAAAAVAAWELSATPEVTGMALGLCSWDASAVMAAAAAAAAAAAWELSATPGVASMGPRPAALGASRPVTRKVCGVEAVEGWTVGGEERGVTCT